MSREDININKLCAFRASVFVEMDKSSQENCQLSLSLAMFSVKLTIMRSVISSSVHILLGFSFLQVPPTFSD